MKRLFLSAMLLDAAINAATGTGGDDKPQPTSEKLVEIRSKIDEALTRQDAAIAAGNRDERIKIGAEIYKLQVQESAELVAIANHAKQLAAIEARNAKIEVVKQLLDAHDANMKASIDKKLSIDEKNAFNDAEKKLFEQVCNMVVGGAPKVPTEKTDGEKTARNSGNADEIVAKFQALLAGGASETDAKKQLEADGYARSTVWHAINNWKKANA